MRAATKCCAVMRSAPGLYTTGMGSPCWPGAASRLGCTCSPSCPPRHARLRQQGPPPSLPGAVGTPVIDILLAMVKGHMGKEMA